jgi:hypothetical protein
MADSLNGTNSVPQRFPTPNKTLVQKGLLPGTGISKSVQPEWEINNDGYGLLESVCKWVVPYGTRAPAKNSEHPYDNRLYCWKTTTAIMPGQVMAIQAYYVGIESGLDTTPQVQITVGSSTEPIDTHNEFVSKIGGKPSAPKNGAIFVDPSTGEKTEDDALGVFAEFSMMTQLTQNEGSEGEFTSFGKNRLAGVKSYYSPTITLKGTFFTKHELNAQKVASQFGRTTTDGNLRGFQAIPPWVLICLGGALNNKGVEGYYQDRNWLITGVNVEEYGQVLKVSYDLTLGGILGWNGYVYKGAF